MMPKTGANSPAENFPGSDITAEELIFLQAIEAYQRRHRKKFLAWTEVLHIVHSLGYRKVPPAETSES